MKKTATIQAAQLKQLISLSGASLVASMLIALMLAYMQRQVIAVPVVVSWLASLAFVLVLRVALLIAFRRPVENAEVLAPARLAQFRMVVLCTGVIWGTAGFLLFPAGYPGHQMFLILALAGVTAGGMMSYSSDLLSASLFSISLIVPLAIRLFAENDTLSVAMGAATALYLAFMTMSIWRVNGHIYKNITLQLEAAEREEEVRASEERYRLLLSHLPVGIFHYNRALVVTYCNECFPEILDVAAGRVVGTDMKQLKDQTIMPALTMALNGQMGSYEGRYGVTHNEGEKWISMTCAPYRDGKGQITGGISIVQDITARREAEETIKSLAFYDPLTNLPNRRLLLDRLRHATAASARSGRNGALLFIDLDNFKTLNDTLGHHMGDALLKEVAQRLLSCVREGDSVARLGGDEFVVMLEDLSAHAMEAAEQTEAVGEKLLAALGQTYLLTTCDYRCTPSVGAVLFSGHQQKEEDLLKQADIAMYQAKKAGRNTLRFFDPEMQAAVAARVALENDLRKAVAGCQLHVYYQVQVDGSGRPTGAEALIRWAHPQRGLLPPSQFMHVAEETDLGVPIGQWAIDTVCAQLKIWQEHAHTRSLVLAVNISANHFRHADFVAQVESAIQRHGINPALLDLELTERALLEDIEKSASTMHALREWGVKFSLDDFGTGYSSLQHLKRLPLDQLKIDQSFIRNIAIDPNDKAIVRTVIAMADSLGLGVIAEGVETAGQWEFLLDNHCVRGQGHLFGPAMPMAKLEALVLRLNDVGKEVKTGCDA